MIGKTAGQIIAFIVGSLIVVVICVGSAVKAAFTRAKHRITPE